MTDIILEQMDATAFQQFGEAFEAVGDPTKWINDGWCARYSDLAAIEAAGDGARMGISLFRSRLRSLPYVFDLLERHPDGSQAFMPMSNDPFLVIVAPDEGGSPGLPRAYLTRPGMAINLRRGTWHGVLTPLAGPGLFAVVDRIGPGANLEEWRFGESFTVIDRDGLFPV